MQISYNLRTELGMTLSPGETYTYQMFADFGGNRYYGYKKTFKTTGQRANSSSGNTNSGSTSGKTGSSSSTSKSSSSGSTSKSSTKSGSTKSSSKKKYYDSYDDGYDDIYMDGDYDYDRYNKDPDYADGVDDAMDEFDW